LGRWVVMTLRGETTTRIICGYNPCGNGRSNSDTVYHQQRQYWITRQRCLTCPRVKFREDLVAQLNRWREQGDKLIVCLDANEDIYKKPIGKALTLIDGLAMQEVVGKFTGRRIVPTYFGGSRPMDAVWATLDVKVAGACIMPAGYGIGDHQLFVLDFVTSSLIGLAPKKIVQPQARRLNCKILGAVKSYNTWLEEKILHHCLLERVGKVHDSDLPQEEKKHHLNWIDVESKNYMKNSKKWCRKIKLGKIPFSPEAVKWIHRAQVYRSLLRFARGKGCNRGNVCRSAYWAGIETSFLLLEADILARIKVCQQHYKYYCAHGKQYHRQHLQEWLEAAKEEENEEAVRQMLGIIKRECKCRFWRRVKYVMGKQHGGSVRSVQVEDERGKMEVFSTWEEVHKAIWSNIHWKGFYLAETAPICNGKQERKFWPVPSTMVWILRRPLMISAMRWP
jgi:hypothetical protein